ncbi:MAG: MiaB/RimO family radical SAM methylthiotransferase, partial [Actinomycetia bacterium]|nr:MiaB/RimO family radical SAM methylthiotransferase [Actinomycetes bacterium]
ALNAPCCTRVIATGCSATIQGEVLSGLDKRVIVEPDKAHIADLISSLADTQTISTQKGSVSLPKNLIRARVNLKISDGCENFCSYCIVPHARGPMRSIPAKDLLKQASDLVEDGVKEIVLTGINIGTYRDGDLDLASLIERLSNESGIHRIRISSIEPPSFGSEMIIMLRNSPVLCEHFHIPLQSGSNKVLGEMNRHYRADQYRELITQIRQVAPDCAIHSDIIVGYPTETEDDFEETLALADELMFAGMHLFKFSSRPQTAAGSLTPLRPEVLDERFARLQEVSKRHARTYREKRLSAQKPLELLVESIKANSVVATSREHIRISWEVGDPAFPNVAVGDIVEYRERERL